VALRSNSFNLTPRRDVARPPGAACPLATGTGTLEGAPEPERAVLLRLRDRMRLCVTETRDFEHAEVARSKALGQIYVDRSRKQLPDDFAADLVALSRMTECAGCPREPSCPGAYRRAAENVFERDDARTREILRGLRGNVLDIGAGDAPYAGELSDVASYLALDPDAERLGLLRARFPRAELLVGDVEALPADREFDHVVLLRSVNHLPDPTPALARAVGLLRTGGTLLMLDDVVFGLVRDAERAERAERRGALFEHHRNDSSEAAHARVAGLPLRLLERRDVGPGTSNQWLLHYQKVGEPST